MTPTFPPQTTHFQSSATAPLTNGATSLIPHIVLSSLNPFIADLAVLHTATSAHNLFVTKLILHILRESLIERRLWRARVISSNPPSLLDASQLPASPTPSSHDEPSAHHTPTSGGGESTSPSSNFLPLHLLSYLPRSEEHTSEL